MAASTRTYGHEWGHYGSVELMLAKENQDPSDFKFAMSDCEFALHHPDKELCKRILGCSSYGPVARLPLADFNIAMKAQTFEAFEIELSERDVATAAWSGLSLDDAHRLIIATRKLMKLIGPEMVIKSAVAMSQIGDLQPLGLIGERHLAAAWEHANNDAVLVKAQLGGYKDVE